MEILYYIYSFMIGLLLGSFYNVVGLRVPKKKSIVFPSSHCTSCQRKLTPFELIPVLSYMLLRGKCKTCGGRVSKIYPLVEISTATLFTISPMVVGWSKELLIAWALISLLVIIFVSDMAYMLIPDKVLIVFGAYFIIIRLFMPLDPWWDVYLGAAIGFVIPLILAIVSKGGMGGGDIKLFAVLGLVLGWQGILLAFMFSSFYGAFFGVIGLLTGKVKRGVPMAFGPYIVLGTLTTYFFGEKIIWWYLNSFIQ